MRNDKKNTAMLPAIFNQDNLPVIKNNSEMQTAIHQAFTPDICNNLFPVAINIDPKLKVQAHIVQLDPNPEIKDNKDWWLMRGKKEPILKANAIRKISAAVGLRWNPKLSGVTHRKEDDSSGQILVLEYTAVGNLLSASGVFKDVTGTYRYSYQDDMDDRQFNIWEKGKDTGKKDMNTINRRRRFALQLCETGAKKRALFDGLGCLEKSYSMADCLKPFVIPVVTDDVDENDPLYRQAIAQRASGSSDAMYGKSDAITADYEVVPDDTSKTPPAAEEKTQPPLVDEKEKDQSEMQLPEPSRREVYLNDMHDTGPQERGEEIRRLAKITNCDISKWKDPGVWELNLQMKWLDELAVKAKEIEPKESE